MFQDEAGFGRINRPKYCWCEKGIRPSVPCHHIREYRYAYGAVEPLTGEGCFLVMPYCNTVCMNIFLKELSERYSEDIILLCCDGAAWHKPRGLELAENVVFFHIPRIRPRWIPLNRFGKRSVNADSETRFLLLWIKSLTACAIPFALCLTMSFPALLAEIG